MGNLVGKRDRGYRTRKLRSGTSQVLECACAHLPLTFDQRELCMRKASLEVIPSSSEHSGMSQGIMT